MKIFNLEFSDITAFRNTDCSIRSFNHNKDGILDIRLDKLLINFNYKKVNFSIDIKFNANLSNSDLITIHVDKSNEVVKVPSIKQDITSYNISTKLKKYFRDNKEDNYVNLPIELEDAIDMLNNYYDKLQKVSRLELRSTLDELTSKNGKLNKSSAKKEINIFKKDNNMYFLTKENNLYKKRVRVYTNLTLLFFITTIALFISDLYILWPITSCITMYLIYKLNCTQSIIKKYQSSQSLEKLFNIKLKNKTTNDIFRLYDFMTINDDFTKAIIFVEGDYYTNTTEDNCEFEYLTIDRLNSRLQILAHNQKLNQQLKSNQLQLNMLTSDLTIDVPYYSEIKKLKDSIDHLQKEQAHKHQRLIEENNRIIDSFK